MMTRIALSSLFCSVATAIFFLGGCSFWEAAKLAIALALIVFVISFLVVPYKRETK